MELSFDRSDGILEQVNIRLGLLLCDKVSKLALQIRNHCLGFVYQPLLHQNGHFSGQSFSIAWIQCQYLFKHIYCPLQMVLFLQHK